jgi:hypothetical protein
MQGSQNVSATGDFAGDVTPEKRIINNLKKNIKFMLYYKK